jgi:Flp pilus assembly protein TadB
MDDQRFYHLLGLATQLAILFFNGLAVLIWYRYRHLSRRSYLCIAGFALSAFAVLVTASLRFGLNLMQAFDIEGYEFLLPFGGVLQVCAAALLTAGAAFTLADISQRLRLLTLAHPQACLPPLAPPSEGTATGEQAPEIDRGTRS